MTIAFHPAKERPKTAAALAFGLGILLQMLWQWLTPVPALVIWLALVVSLRDFYLPSTYSFDSKGLSIKRPLCAKHYSWERFRAFVSDRNGLFLSPYRTRRATENQRGVFLPMAKDQRLKALDFCSKMGLEKRAK